LKQTRYKKLAPFLLEQAKNGLISIKATPTDPVAFVTDVNKNHISLRETKETIRNNNETGSSSNSATAEQTKMAIVNLHVVPHHIVNWMKLDPDAVAATEAKSVERRGTGFLTKPECRAILNHYIRTNDLLMVDQVTLDGPLVDSLYRIKKASKQEAPVQYPTHVSQKELYTKWLGKMEAAHAVVAMPGSRILSMKRGEPLRVTVVVESRNAKKHITKVRGLEQYGFSSDPESFCQDVAKRFACAGSVEPTGEQNNKIEWVFQGHLSQELTALLLGDETLSSHGGVKNSPYRLPKGVIDVILRKKVRPIK
jgi:translation initiation factor 2D